MIRVLVVGTVVEDHRRMVDAAEPVLDRMALENGFDLEFTRDASVMTEANLARYQAFVMLQLAPFDIAAPQQAALQGFVEAGGGWVGIHAAGLTGREFIGSDATYWQWFEQFMGGVLYSPHPAYQRGTAVVEDPSHPVMQGLPARFDVADEWYEWNGSPRGNARVLATADESTFRQVHPMGDHPIVWTNPNYRRMVYIALGHDPTIFDSGEYLRLLRNSIAWAGSP